MIIRDTLTDDDRADGFAQEIWTYGGICLDSAKKRSHMWISPDGHRLLYADKGSFVLGGRYFVRVKRDGDGKATSRRTVVTYSGEMVDQEERASLRAAEVIAEAKLAEKRMTTRDRNLDPLDEALAPLMKIVGKMARTGADRDFIIAYINRQLYSAW